MKTKTIKVLIFALLLTQSLASCTDNQRARRFGGTQTITLSKGTKLVNATWKDDDLWILTRAANQGEQPQVYTFKEDSSFGVIEGTVTIKEQ